MDFAAIFSADFGTPISGLNLNITDSKLFSKLPLLE